MARYNKPTRPAMTVAIASVLAKAAKDLDSDEGDGKLAPALVLIGILSRYEVGRSSVDAVDIFDRAEACLTDRDAD